jgi:peptidoglycan/LPS O-acetylase OafA/YrhL
MLGPHLDWRWYNIFDIDGVTIFFVLSGFLIGGILLKLVNRTDFRWKDLRSFWVRRWFRTLPNYYLILLLIVALELFLPQPRSAFPPSGGLWRYFFFLQNFHYPHPDFFPEAWSLCVEEGFYLIIPFLLYLSFRILNNSRKQVFLFWIIVIILWATAFRIYRIRHYQIHDVSVWAYHIGKEVVTRVDSIMYGCFGAYMLFYHKDVFYRFRKPLLVIGILLLIAPHIVFGFFYRNGERSLKSI